MVEMKQFRAMAVRAAFAVETDGVVFSETSRDTLDKDWEQLPEETRKHWEELAELLSYTLNPSRRLTAPNLSGTTTH